MEQKKVLKGESSGTIRFDAEGHSEHICQSLCKMLEKGVLTDVAVICGGNTVLAHKFVLAANSIYFKEHLKNKAVQQIKIKGLDFTVMKSLIEYMYSAECVVSEHHLGQLIAAVKFFNIIGLENAFDGKEYQSLRDIQVTIPEPEFICTPLKFAPTTTSAKSLPPNINSELARNVQGQQKHAKCEVNKELVPLEKAENLVDTSDNLETVCQIKDEIEIWEELLLNLSEDIKNENSGFEMDTFDEVNKKFFNP